MKHARLLLFFAMAIFALGQGVAIAESVGGSIGKQEKTLSGGQETEEPGEAQTQKSQRRQKEEPSEPGASRNSILGSWSGTYYCHASGDAKGTISLTIRQGAGGGLVGSEEYSRGVLGGSVQHRIVALQQGRYRFNSQATGFASFPYQVSVQYSSEQLIGTYINHPNCDRFVLHRQ
jgi:hypothetical protein